MAAATQFSQDDKMAKALATYTQALASVAALRGDPRPIGADAASVAPSMWDALEAELRVHCAGVLFELDSLADMQAQLQAARPLLDLGLRHAPDHWQALHAAWLFERARLDVLTRNLASAQELARTCIGLLEPTSSACYIPPLLPRARAVLGAALGMGGQAQAAIEQFECALREADRPMARLPPREHGRLLTNLGAALWAQGANDAGIRNLRHAVTIFEGLVAAGRGQQHIDIARTRMNLGGALLAGGQLDEAVRCLHQSWAGYRRMVHAPGPLQGTDRLMASCAMAEMNYGYALFKAGQLRTAEQRIGHALLRHSAHLANQPWLADDLARIRVNRAHLLMQGGRHGLAAKYYATGRDAFRTLIASGRTSLHADEANALLGLGRCQVAQGKWEPASANLGLALQILGQLIESGQLQHARAWVQGWRAHVDAILQSATHAAGPGLETRGRRHSLRRARQDQAIVAACEWLQAAPRLALASGPQPLDDLSDGLDQLDQWQARPAASATHVEHTTMVCGSFYKHLLACVADLIGDASPTWLATHQAQAAALTERLCLFAHSLPDGSQWMADWFLHTHGLRAQRSALMAGDAEPVVALRALYDELRRLEETILAGWRAAPGSANSEHRHGLATQPAAGSAPAMGASATAAIQQAEAMAVDWLSLRQRCDALRQGLVQDGLLPAQLRMDSAGLAQAMSPGTALLMLAPLPGQAQLIIALRKPAGGHSLASHHTAQPPSAFGKFSCRTLHALARQALAGAAGGAPRRTVVNLAETPISVPPNLPPSMALDRFALDGLGALARAAVLPTIQSLAAQGATEFALVPTGDLHLLPWSFALAGDLPAGCTLTTYPDCAAFARHGAGPAPKNVGQVRWAVAAQPNADSQRRLPWAGVELQLSRQLWLDDGAAMTMLDAHQPRAENVNALLGIGHGVAPGQNLACAGLLMADQKVLTAHQLTAVKTCRRVLLSCCVLGQIDTVAGEALGFLSACFGHQTEFGMGWLIDVPDAEACLFSVAFQFGLRQAGGSPTSTTVRWGQVFNDTRNTIEAGHWPAGFAAWLESNLPVAIAASAEPGLTLPTNRALAAPPPMLRRLMPWTIALGR